MNISDTTLLELREQVFNDYRVALESAKNINEELSKLRSQEHEKERERSIVYAKAEELKAIIDVMIEQDCDPVVAKLKYEELITSKKDYVEKESAAVPYHPVYYNSLYNTLNAGTKIYIDSQT